MYLHGNYFSKILGRYINYLNVFPTNFSGIQKQIILLSGRGFDESSWCLNVPLEDLANKYHVAFFCVAGENSFYTNHSDGENYASAFGDEFIIQMKQLFRLEFKAKNTEIAGFSMGGYGALLLGLRYHQYYSRIGAFSPAFIFYKKKRQEPMYNHIFSKGDYNSENDVLYWYQQLVKKNQKRPALFLSCGDQDPLFIQTKRVINKIKKITPQENITFLKQEGYHDFSIWRPALISFLDHKI